MYSYRRSVPEKPLEDPSAPQFPVPWHDCRFCADLSTCARKQTSQAPHGLQFVSRKSGERTSRDGCLQTCTVIGCLDVGNANCSWEDECLRLSAEARHSGSHHHRFPGKCPKGAYQFLITADYIIQVFGIYPSPTGRENAYVYLALSSSSGFPSDPYGSSFLAIPAPQTSEIASEASVLVRVYGIYETTSRLPDSNGSNSCSGVTVPWLWHVTLEEELASEDLRNESESK
ncbi:hypothetical protein CB1_001919021 [Camelus ferus]|nr:hypothetical protein CB1_001919021 [Camelus ferus]